MIPIFDALAHPTLSGKWLHKQLPASFELLLESMNKSGFSRACAIGMDGIEAYEHEAFLKQCLKHQQLTPIAGFNPIGVSQLETELKRLADMGFKGIKIHPRFSGIDTASVDLAPCFKIAGKLGLRVFYCTYQHCGLPHYPIHDPFYALVRWLQNAPSTKVILVHGGNVELMRYAELVRFNPNLLLDLSLTFMKYAGSSLDADIAFLFRSFDRRICIGTDFPEYSHKAVRTRFEHFAQGIPEEKLHNIAHKNLTTFLS